jgi:hypothetical protein
MPRKKRQLDVTLDGGSEDGLDGGGVSTIDVSQLGDDAGGSVTADVLLERARQFIQLNAEIHELSAQTKAVRKSLKAVEEALLQGMVVSKTERLECDGQTIHRSKKLQLTAE